MHNTFDPGSAFSATASAPASVAPAEMPTKMPSLVASSPHKRNASLPSIGMIASIILASTASSVSFGMKSGLQPCIKCGRNNGWLSAGVPSSSRSWGMPLPSMGELSGSQTMIFVSGLFSLSTRDTPFSVPPVPKPVTQKSSFLSAKASRISGAVVRECASALASFSNCRTRNQPCFSASSVALANIPLPFKWAGVSTTLTPIKRIILRRSMLKLSAIVTTKG